MTLDRHLPTGSADLALLRSALGLAARGWRVFPCAAGGKRPAFRQNWQNVATTDPARILAWWSSQPYNIGLSCGPSGFVVIDLDVPHGSPAGKESEQVTGAGATGSFAELCRRYDEPYPPATFSVGTPSGGCHLHFAATGTRLRNSAGLLGPLIDVRATGGYVIGPGSRIGQRAYTVRDSSPPMPLPPWITGLLLSTRSMTPNDRRLPIQAYGQGTAYAQAALREETRRVGASRPGSRNDTLNRAAFSLGQLVAAGLIAPRTVSTALSQAASELDGALPADFAD
jgi:hypothetical protein